MGKDRLSYAAPEMWASKAMEHLQEAWETMYASLTFADKKQLLDMKQGVEQISAYLEKEIAEFDNRPKDSSSEDDSEDDPEEDSEESNNAR